MSRVKLFEQFINEGYQDSVHSDISKLAKESEMAHNKLVKIITGSKNDKGLGIEEQGPFEIESKVSSIIKKRVASTNAISNEEKNDKTKYWIDCHTNVGEIELSNIAKKYIKQSGKQFEDFSEFWEYQLNDENRYDSMVNHPNAIKEKHFLTIGVSRRSAYPKDDRLSLQIIPPMHGNHNRAHDDIGSGFMGNTAHYNVAGYMDGIDSFGINVDNNDELLVAIEETIGNSNFIKLVELISVKTTEQWILQRFQKWKLEAPTREDEYAKDQDRRDSVEKQKEFLKGRKTDTSDAWHRFDKEGTIVKNKKAYSLRDFEEVAEIFDKFNVIENGPKLRRSGYDGISYDFYYSDKKGAWEGGSEGYSESMSLVEFVSIAKNK